MAPPARPGPIEAHCAVLAGQPLDLDLVRRTAASAQWAASNVHGLPWPRLAAKGWQVLPVRVSVVGDGAPAEAPPAAAPRRKKAAPPPPAPPALPSTSERAPESGPAGGRMKLLRLGDL